jgi:hypothetical protein
MANGRRFEYHYEEDMRGPSKGLVPDLITDLHGLLTYLRYGPEGYTQSLPM